MRWVLLILSAALPMGAWADDALTPVHFDYGSTTLDINGDGLKDIVLRTRWTSLSAHGFDRYVVSVQEQDENGRVQYNQVPLGDAEQQHDFRTVEGADCFRQGYDFFLNAKHQLVVKEYSLPEGKSIFCEAALMITKVYEMRKDVDEDGFAFFLPLWKLKKTDEILGTKQVNDVRPFIK